MIEPSPIDWPEPLRDDAWPEPFQWPEPVQDDDWPEPEPEPGQSESTEPVNILDQFAGCSGVLVCGCDPAMVIATGMHLKGCTHG